LHPDLFRAQVDKLAHNINQRFQEEEHARYSGIIVNTNGWIEFKMKDIPYCCMPRTLWIFPSFLFWDTFDFVTTIIISIIIHAQNLEITTIGWRRQSTPTLCEAFPFPSRQTLYKFFEFLFASLELAFD
jgi:hypothetical protein